jgi:hypothetical protein
MILDIFYVVATNLKTFQFFSENSMNMVLSKNPTLEDVLNLPTMLKELRTENIKLIT